MYDPTNESYNTSMNMESRQSAMQDFEMSRYQEMEFVAMSIARNLDITEKNASCASDLNSASLNVSYNVNPTQRTNIIIGLLYSLYLSELMQ
ncbi:hypothetical protein CDAR_122051 [Caerostris darwini]|uniref:Uncharacterized protein n=1 Tax=Caerostris darwini TaxID=1538125 RepID=A0AAV4SZF9_9ARAC|nr:hypothetical protein CDAR_122051 [Caerostris darwini]